MCGGTPKPPPPPPKAPEAPVMPDAEAGSNTSSQDRRRRAAATGQGSRSTVLTGSRGVTSQGGTTRKTLLGQ